MFTFLIAFTSSFFINADTVIPVIPNPNLSLKTEQEAFRYEDSLGGKLIYWKYKHQVAVFSHKNGNKEGYASYYVFNDPDKNKLTAVAYTMMHPKWLYIGNKENDTATLYQEGMISQLGIDPRCKNFAEIELKNKSIPRYDSYKVALLVSSIEKWLKEKYPKGFEIGKAFVVDRADFLSHSNKELSVEFSLGTDHRILISDDGFFHPSIPFINLSIIICLNCSMEAHQVRIEESAPVIIESPH